VFKTLIFNASAIVLHEMTYCLSCFLCSQYSVVKQMIKERHDVMDDMKIESDKVKEMWRKYREKLLNLERMKQGYNLYSV